MGKTKLQEHKDKTQIGFFYSIAGVTLPFLLSLLGIAMINKYEFVVSFVDDGQFLLFSAGLLTSAYYILRDEENQRSLAKSSIKNKKVLNHATVLLLIVSSVMYALLYFVQISDAAINLNVWFIRASSLLLFSFSCYASYNSIFVDFLKVYPPVDVKKESTMGVNNIMDQLGK